MKFKIKNNELIEDVKGGIEDFPKYTTQIINLANQNSQGTRPKVVGQMSDLIQEFKGNKYDDWVNWYLEKMPNAVDDATKKIFDMVEKLKESITQIDKELVRKWVEDLVITKTFVGLKFQESILKRVAESKNTTHRLAKPEEESKGIDGFIGEIPVSIKPITYQTKNMLREQIKVHMIFYDKKKDGISVEFDF
jgi:wobble nucleotide-excising tRNase